MDPTRFAAELHRPEARTDIPIQDDTRNRRRSDGESAVQDVLGHVLQVLDTLHIAKDRAYGDAWRRRGEVLGIFANIARKADRLEIAMQSGDPATVESMADTAADLAVYAAKYLTWLAEVYPRDFQSVAPSPPADECSARRGPAGVRTVFRFLPSWERPEKSPAPESVSDAGQRVLRVFTGLEVGLMAQAEHPPTVPMPAAVKTATAWALLDASARLLVRIAQLHPTQLEGLTRTLSRENEQAS